jgi:hypothetical protein
MSIFFPGSDSRGRCGITSFKTSVVVLNFSSSYLITRVSPLVSIPRVVSFCPLLLFTSEF